MHDGSRSNRGLAATVGTLECPGPGLQPPSLATTATWANKPVRPTRRDQILCASRLVAKALLELDQRAREVCHDGRPGCGGFPICSISVIHLRRYYILGYRTQRDKAFHKIHLIAVRRVSWVLPDQQSVAVG